MPDNEAGAFLNITPDVLKKLDCFDEKLEKLERLAQTAAGALRQCGSRYFQIGERNRFVSQQDKFDWV